MKQRVFSVCYLLFSVLFFIYPFFYAAVNIRPVIALALLLFALAYLKNRRQFRIELSHNQLLGIVLGLYVVTRVLAVAFLCTRTVQTSDFAAAFQQIPVLDFRSDVNYYANFVHWIFWPVVQHYILAPFGYTQLSVMVLNAVILFLVTLLIFKVCALLTKNDKCAFVAAAFYIFWPANILYVSVNTQEHLAALLILLVVWLLLRHNPEKGSAVSLLRFAAVGILLGVCVFLKNFSMVIFIAMAITAVMWALKYKFSWRQAVLHVLLFAVAFGLFSATSGVLYRTADKLVGQPVNRSVAPCYAYVGLHSSGTGGYSLELYQRYFSVLASTGYDYDETNRIILDELVHDIKDNERIDVLLDRKATVAMVSDKARVQFVKGGFLEAGHEYAAEFLINDKSILDVQKINDWFYYIIMWCMAFGLIFAYRHRDLKFFFIYLSIFGSALLLLLVEAQGRYMYGIQPLYCVAAGFGLYSAWKLAANHFAGNRKPAPQEESDA